MTRPMITEIGTELAVPFVVAYCATWSIPCDTQAAENVWWWGAWYQNALRAVLGMMPTLPPAIAEALPELAEDDDALFVYGIYGDGTPREERAITALIRALDRVPSQLIGSILLPNQRIYRAARKRGWNLHATLPRNLARVVTRPAIELQAAS